MNAKTAKQAVEIKDDFAAELQAGAKFAQEFYATGRRTLVSTISPADLAAWNGSDELALVSDPDGIDLPDEEAPKAA